MDVWFTEADVRRQLASLGYRDVPKDILDEFIHDLQMMALKEAEQQESHPKATKDHFPPPLPNAASPFFGVPKRVHVSSEEEHQSQHTSPLHSPSILLKKQPSRTPSLPSDAGNSSSKPKIGPPHFPTTRVLGNDSQQQPKKLQVTISTNEGKDGEHDDKKKKKPASNPHDAERLFPASSFVPRRAFDEESDVSSSSLKSSPVKRKTMSKEGAIMVENKDPVRSHASLKTGNYVLDLFDKLDEVEEAINQNDQQIQNKFNLFDRAHSDNDSLLAEHLHGACLGGPCCQRRSPSAVIRPHEPPRIPKQDPVQRHARFREEWTSLNLPGRDSHGALRWRVREALRTTQDLPKAPPRHHLRPNTYVPPTSKKRQALRWAVREHIQHLT